ncbi:hypothetical protein QAD02_013904 [Eretmocerus hayati]|uniref:Uncharacterized protein n=1 Tax=Eretmocerus hayati TaxID=131215 RepID=A0ACC2P6L8_9HYME|nr:hypothetical protein QAD02_013904 [Eretmocerus hayati]
MLHCADEPSSNHPRPSDRQNIESDQFHNEMTISKIFVTQEEAVNLNDRKERISTERKSSRNETNYTMAETGLGLELVSREQEPDGSQDCKTCITTEDPPSCSGRVENARPAAGRRLRGQSVEKRLRRSAIAPVTRAPSSAGRLAVGYEKEQSLLRLN